ncbi:phage tail tape measure protein [Rhodobacter sp. KR11]|uniref:phage tail tape measure protein n=1 Tax=Rhodobacter sp. KR11 TaxID=2974588 RepID=UPI0022214325|nr:phage tail tape measure protein [Rhodobacter sp. KR11]MCW1918017.1 phage tail tape measure protein [Rhodobacter sp. KR11]
MAEVTELTDQIAALETALTGTVGMVSTFEAELSKMQESLVFTGREVSTLASGFSSGLSRAFGDVVFGGSRLDDALKGLAKSMSQTVFNTAMKPVSNAVGGFLAGGLNSLFGGAFAKGGAFTSGQVTPFAQGGIVSSPTNFGMRGGMGLMGEAGPEAIMPLTRGADGKLGVRAQGGGGGVTVVMNISTPDVAGFQRSQSQIAAQAMQALSRGNRNR